MMRHTRKENLCAGDVNRRRNCLRNEISRSGLFRFFLNELNSVFREDSELTALVEGAQDEPLYTGFDEFM